MEIPNYEPFYLHTLDDLRAEIARLGLTIPVEENVSVLAQPLNVGGKRMPNRFCAQPITGCDGTPEGAPGELTRRRYERYAAGGFGLIWVEATGGDARRLRLNDGTLDTFRSMIDTMRAAAPENPTIILQLAPVLDDELIHTATLAARAGFDGIDVQTHASLETLAAIRAANPKLLLAVRLTAYDATRGGFGVSASDYRKPDLTEPIALAQRLHAAGVTLLNVTCSSPNLRDRTGAPHTDSELPDEHPLMTLDRQLRIARALREAVPGVAVVGSGFSWLRAFVPQVAAAAIAGGAMDFAGLGRGALAYPDTPAHVFARGKMEPSASCIVCFACSVLRDSSDPVGCVIRDSTSYGGVYRHMRRFDADQLLAGAQRCHLCEAAPCITASPAHTDIPAFIAAFLRGDERAAYEIIRARDPLPELTSQLSPAWLQSEGACIETALTGTPVPILDLQYAISWRARERGETGARILGHTTSRRIAIVGAGPTGIAAAIRLVEHGHTVALFESSDRLGGTPERVIPASRMPDLRAEIDAALDPAITSGRLKIHFNATLGGQLSLDQLRRDHDAVLLAVGLWLERSLGKAPGVVSGLSFLEAARRDATLTVPERVAILAGGDSAMDATRTAQSRGAKEIFIVFGGPRSAMHWHMPESWFATPGVHAMMEWQPLGYEAGGVRIRHTQFGVESVLAAGLIIEAMGLEAADPVRAIESVYAAGAIVNGGASVGQCVAEGVAIAETIHRDLTR